jgi:hypothetical protein
MAVIEVGELFFSDPTRRRELLSSWPAGGALRGHVYDANRRRKFRDLAEHGSREGSKVDTLSNTSLTSNRGDHPLQRELLQRSPDSYGLPTVSTRSTTPPHGSVTPPRALVQMSSALSGGSSMSNTLIAGAITPSDVSRCAAVRMYSSLGMVTNSLRWLCPPA